MASAPRIADSCYIQVIHGGISVASHCTWKGVAGLSLRHASYCMMNLLAAMSTLVTLERSVGSHVGLASTLCSLAKVNPYASTWASSRHVWFGYWNEPTHLPSLKDFLTYLLLLVHCVMLWVVVLLAALRRLGMRKLLGYRVALVVMLLLGQVSPTEAVMCDHPCRLEREIGRYGDTWRFIRRCYRTRRLRRRHRIEIRAGSGMAGRLG